MAEFSAACLQEPTMARFSKQFAKPKSERGSKYPIGTRGTSKKWERRSRQPMDTVTNRANVEFLSWNFNLVGYNVRRENITKSIDQWIKGHESNQWTWSITINVDNPEKRFVDAINLKTINNTTWKVQPNKTAEGQDFWVVTKEGDTAATADQLTTLKRYLEAWDVHINTIKLWQININFEKQEIKLEKVPISDRLTAIGLPAIQVSRSLGGSSAASYRPPPGFARYFSGGASAPAKK